MALVRRARADVLRLAQGMVVKVNLPEPRGENT
jgi:hypothetical protein